METSSTRTTWQTPPCPLHQQSLSRLPRVMHFVRDQHSLFSIIADLSPMQLGLKMSRLKEWGHQRIMCGCPSGITDKGKAFTYSASCLINIMPEVKHRQCQKNNGTIFHVSHLPLQSIPCSCHGMTKCPWTFNLCSFHCFILSCFYCFIPLFIVH